MIKTTPRHLGLLLLASLGCAACDGSGDNNGADTGSNAEPGSYPIVDTGQHRSFNNTTEVPAPAAGEAFYGQDAQHTKNAPAYHDNGDGTVTDLVTSLVWQKSAQALTYDQAVAMLEGFTLAGSSDWRLPTIKEAYSLMNFAGADPSSDPEAQAEPFIDTQVFDFEYGFNGDRPIDTQLLTSTKYVSTVMGGQACFFGVNLADGRIKCYEEVDPQGAKKFTVRLVRSPSGTYGLNHLQLGPNKDVVEDLATSLMWSRADSGAGMNWQAALAYAQEKNAENYLGYADWRLPNAKELQSIVDYTRSPDTSHAAAIDPRFEVTKIQNEGGADDYPAYWTSTTHRNASGSAAAAVYIAFGRALGYFEMPPGSGAQLMDVHGAGAQRSDPKTGDAADYPQGNGPQGDVVRIQNYVRLVRDLN